MDARVLGNGLYDVAAGKVAVVATRLEMRAPRPGR